jgi:hypothetical protein
MQGYERDRQLLHDLTEFYGLKPAALAREAGVAVTTINRPYSGAVTTRLSQPTLDKLRARFPQYPGWKTYYTDGGDGPDLAASVYTAEQLGWLNDLLRLSSADREAIVHLIRSLSGVRPSPTVHGHATDFWAERKKRER